MAAGARVLEMLTHTVEADGRLAVVGGEHHGRLICTNRLRKVPSITAFVVPLADWAGADKICGVKPNL